MSQNKLELDRIIFFSDAVFAIAITLLALNVKPPDESNSAQLPFVYLLSIVFPKFQSYVISFLVIAIYWVGHHRYFRYIKRYDYTLFWLNIIFLMCIVFLPFPTALLDDYGGHRAAVMFYAGSMTITGLMKVLIWCHASYRHRLISHSLSNGVVRSLTYRALIPPTVFLSSIPLASFSPTIAEISWLSILIMFVPWRRLERRFSL
ncbi:MAG TPA: TMEM175 family protein [Trichocoleus sp.]